MHKPYEDQLEFYHDINHSLAQYKKIIPCAATGFGKSLIIAMICAAATAKGRTLLVITESEKIYRQLNEDIKETYNINSTSKIKYVNTGKVHLAMAQTLARRPGLIEQFAALGDSLITINDEAHVGTATKTLLQLPDCYLLGFTATPDARIGRHLPELYKSIVIGKQPEWLVANNRLSEYRHANKVKKGVNVDKVLKKDNKGEFTEESQERYFDAPDSINNLVSDLKSMDYKKAMVYCASIKSANIVGAALREHGIQCAIEHSKVEGAKIDLSHFLDHTNTDINVCVSVGSMTKGFDYPAMDLIVLYRATTSLALYLQMIGRGARKWLGKLFFTVLDYGGNASRHKLWTEDHDWEEMWCQPKRKKEGVAPIKECPVCDYLAPSSATFCPNCGHLFERQAKSEVGELETVYLDTSKKNIPEAPPDLLGLTVSSLSPEQLARYAQAFTDKKNYAIRVAKAKEMQEPGYLRTFGMAMGYKQGWAYIHTPKSGERIEFHDIIIK